MATSFSIEHDGRRIEVLPESSWTSDRVRLLIDGEPVAEAKPAGPETVLSAPGVQVRAVMPWHGASITRAELVRADADPLPLEPEPGSRAARRARLERERPGLYAARHVAKGVAQAVLAVIGVTFAIRLLPDLPLPSIDLPDLPLPSIDLPELALPSLDVPGWVAAILQSKAIWLPVLLGIAIAAREYRRLRRRRLDGR